MSILGERKFRCEMPCRCRTQTTLDVLSPKPKKGKSQSKYKRLKLSFANLGDNKARKMKEFPIKT
eukprot:2469164-Amphidinium_carterae.1